MADLTTTEATQAVSITSDGVGTASFGAGTTSNTVLRAVLPTDQTGINTDLDKSGSGAFTALNQTLVATTSGCSMVSFNVVGTWVGTIVIEGSHDSFATSFNMMGITPGVGAINNSFSINTVVHVACGGVPQVRLRASAWTSGTANITWNSGSGTKTAHVFNLVASNLLTQAWLVDGLGNALTSRLGTTLRGLDVTETPVALNRYSLPVNIRQTAASVIGVTVWAMRNVSGPKTVYVEDIILNMGFDVATPVTRQTPRYDLVRFSTATPTAGTALTVIEMDNANGATNVTDARFLDTGLTTTSVVFASAFATIGKPAVDQSGVASFNLQKCAITLAPGEGLAIRLNTATLAGVSLTGHIGWSER